MKTTLSVFTLIVCSLLLVGCGTKTQEFQPKVNGNPTPITQPVDDQPEDQPIAEQPTSPQVVADGIATPWVYETYNEDAFTTALAEGKKVVLNFSATRCPVCQALKKDILATTLPANSVIFEVDYDTNPDLKETYGVTAQTTVIKINPDKSAAETQRAPSIQTILTWLQ